MKLLMSTGNTNKLNEARLLLEPIGIRVLGLSDVFENPPDVIEDRDTLEGNAMKKAVEIAKLTNVATFSDDTGLEVDGLNGAPGVFSARYAGDQADARANRFKMLKEMEAKTERSARFRTVIAFVDGKRRFHFEGECLGQIVEEERGGAGFGYDKIFQPDGFSTTFAEMTMKEKSTISHRGRALKKFTDFLRDYEVEN